MRYEKKKQVRNIEDKGCSGEGFVSEGGRTLAYNPRSKNCYRRK